MKKSCKNCIYREDSCSEENETCGDWAFGDPEDRAEHEMDMNDFTGEEDFDGFMDHEDLD